MDAILSQKAFMIHSNLFNVFFIVASAACVVCTEDNPDIQKMTLNMSMFLSEKNFCDILRQIQPNFLNAFDLWLEGFALVDELIKCIPLF